MSLVFLIRYISWRKKSLNKKVLSLIFMYFEDNRQTLKLNVTYSSKMYKLFSLSLMQCNSRENSRLKLQQIFFQHFNKHNVNIHFNNVSFVNTKLHFFLASGWAMTSWVATAECWKNFSTANLLVLIYFSRLMIRITMFLQKDLFLLMWSNHSSCSHHI